MAADVDAIRVWADNSFNRCGDAFIFEVDLAQFRVTTTLEVAKPVEQPYQWLLKRRTDDLILEAFPASKALAAIVGAWKNT